MEIFYNEISNRPLANNETEARQKVLILLDTLKELRAKDFNIMRTHSGFYADLISSNYSFANFFNDPAINNTLKILLRSITASPFIHDDDSNEADLFIMNGFSTKNHLHEDVSPEGLASAYIFNSPTLSLIGEFWKRQSLLLFISNAENEDQPITVEVPNVYSAESVSNSFFIGWLNSLTEGVQLNSIENIYKLFPRDKFLFESQAIDDIISWYYDDKRFLVRIKDLLNDIAKNPFKGGKGKTETLSGTGGVASKRIVKKDRIVYTFTSEKIIIHQCRKHYNDK